jgi:hypothetical protein
LRLQRFYRTAEVHLPGVFLSGLLVVVADLETGPVIALVAASRQPASHEAFPGLPETIGSHRRTVDGVGAAGLLPTGESAPSVPQRPEGFNSRFFR